MSRHGKAISEINVTPLVDVMLVLLIIFMVAAPMMQRGINVNLPRTKTASSVHEDRLVLTIDAQGKVYIHDRPVKLIVLKDWLIHLYEHSSDQMIFIKADKHVAYGHVLRVMDMVRQAGFQQISLVTIPIIPHEKEQ